jgi:hypothetical protein
MAAPSDRKLLAAARKAAAALKVAARWAVSKRPVNVRDDFIYETYLYVRLLHAAGRTFRIVYVPGTGPTAHAFPRAPANKKARPRFELHDQRGVRFQLCAGTKVRDMNGDERAPDVSLQVGRAGDLPIVGEVLAIWDAKYKGGQKRISEHEFSTFARWLELLGLRTGAGAPIALGTLRDLEGHCLVTNGHHSTELAAELKRTNVREIASFYPGRAHTRRP